MHFRQRAHHVLEAAPHQQLLVLLFRCRHARHRRLPPSAGRGPRPPGPTCMIDHNTIRYSTSDFVLIEKHRKACILASSLPDRLIDCPGCVGLCTIQSRADSAPREDARNIWPPNRNKSRSRTPLLPCQLANLTPAAGLGCCRGSGMGHSKSFEHQKRGRPEPRKQLDTAPPSYDGSSRRKSLVTAVPTAE